MRSKYQMNKEIEDLTLEVELLHVKYSGLVHAVCGDKSDSNPYLFSIQTKYRESWKAGWEHGNKLIKSLLEDR